MNLENDEVWDAINSRLFSTKRGSGGYIQINCPMCVSMGTSRDTRKRCGLKKNISGFGINCFNCGFKARFNIGDQLSKRIQSFMEEIGVPFSDINRLKHWAWQIHKIQNPQLIQKQVFTKPFFKTISLPEGTKSILEFAENNFDHPKFLRAANYVLDRGHSADPKSLYWCEEYSDYVLIPCIFAGKIVGYAGRATSLDIEPKYNNINIPKNFLFNCDVMLKTNRIYLIIVEGIFDALSIDGISSMGAKMNQYQIDWLNNCSMQKIIVPDKDHTGKRLIKTALENNWYISAPYIGKNALWDKDIKDADDAVKRYGKLWTVNSILEKMTKNPLEISLIEDFIK